MRKLTALISIILISILLTACGKELTRFNSTVIAKREITDMIGRKVTIPSDVKKVYATSAVGTIFVYSIDPSKLIGQAGMSAKDSKYVLEQYRNLPVLGGMNGAENNNAVREKVVKAAPDIILSTTMEASDDVAAASNADILQEQLGIPVIVFTSNLSQLDKTYEFMGELLGDKERAKVLANYCRNTISEIKLSVAKIPEEKRLRVYYAEGETGLNTIADGSRHNEVLDFVQGINVAKVPMDVGQAAVSLEKVMFWNPDVILVGKMKGEEGNLPEFIKDNSSWKNIKAVKEHQVYKIPNQPFSWLDRPPSINRIIGIKWLANLLYADYVKIDIKAETKNFYRIFYHYELTEQEVEDLLKYSTPK